MTMVARAFVPDIARLSARVILILGCNPGPMTLQGTNTYLIGSGKRRILLDTGDENVPQYINNLSKVLKEETCSIEHIILTHWHHDHVGGVTDILNITEPNCTVWKYRRSDGMEDMLPKNTSFQYLENGQILSTSGASVRIIHTPGHTTDHIALSLLEENSLFSGDTILGEGTAVFEDLYDYMNSLEAMKNLSADIIYPGHGPVVKNPTEVLNYYLEHRRQRENQIITVLAESKTPLNISEITAVLYMGIDEKLVRAAQNNVRKTLVKLLTESRVIQSDDNWSVP